MSSGANVGFVDVLASHVDRLVGLFGNADKKQCMAFVVDNGVFQLDRSGKIVLGDAPKTANNQLNVVLGKLNELRIVVNAIYQEAAIMGIRERAKMMCEFLGIVGKGALPIDDIQFLILEGIGKKRSFAGNNTSIVAD